MDRDALVAWALANGWEMLEGHPSLAKGSAPKAPIVRLVTKATVVNLEIRKPAGKWEKVAGCAYAALRPDPESGVPQGLGFEALPMLGTLMREARDRRVFAGFGRPGG